MNCMQAMHDHGPTAENTPLSAWRYVSIYIEAMDRLLFAGAASFNVIPTSLWDRARGAAQCK